MKNEIKEIINQYIEIFPEETEFVENTFCFFAQKKKSTTFVENY